MSDTYILDDENHVIPADLMTWSHFLHDHKRRIVKQTTTRFHWVSTVFLGLNYRFMGEGPPVVFETMTFAREEKIKEIFGRLMRIREEADDVDHGFGRHCSWDDALTFHDTVVSRLRRAERKAVEMARATT